MVGQECNLEVAGRCCPLLKWAREGMTFTPVQARMTARKFEELEKNHEEAVALTG